MAWGLCFPFPGCGLGLRLLVTYPTIPSDFVLRGSWGTRVGSLVIERLERDHFQECSQGEEQDGEEDNGTGAGFGGCIAGEETVRHASGDEKEGLLLGHQEEDDAGSQEQSALQPA